MPADGNLTDLAQVRARRSGPQLHVVQQANASGFPPVSDLPRARFHPADGGAVRLGVARIEADAVDELLHLFQREAAKAMREGDRTAADRIWNLHDDLSAAESGLTPEPPQPDAA
ncbi:hypothetical protein [Synechococcus phage Ssp-JY42]|nr:hypothetical protein [Synechococcus phage Yong-M4-211]